MDDKIFPNEQRYSNGFHSKYTAASYGILPNTGKNVKTQINKAIQLASASGDNKTIFFEAGLYLIGSPIIWLNGVNLIFDRKAEIRATASMVAMIDTLKALDGDRLEFNSISGGYFNCNHLADRGIWLRYFKETTITDTRVDNAKINSFHFGDSGAPRNSYGLSVIGVKTYRDFGIGAPTGSVGMYFESTCSDNRVIDAAMTGSETGFYVGSASNTLMGCTAWSQMPNNRILIGYNVTGSNNAFINCIADGCGINGFIVGSWRCSYVSCRVYNPKNYTYTNSVVGYLFKAGQQKNKIINPIFQADTSVGASIAQDFSFEDGIDTAVGANQNQVLFPSYTGVNSNTTFPSTFVGATSGRTYAITKAKGTMYYDTTLGKPIWWNGTAWTDASGTVV